MNPSIERKLEGLLERYQEVQALLGEADVIADQNRFRALSKEYSQLEELVDSFLSNTNRHRPTLRSA